VNRLYILLVVMVVMAAAFFAGHEALAKVLTGTAGEDTLVGTDRYDRLERFSYRKHPHRPVAAVGEEAAGVLDRDRI
jgi:hypothetical protein